MTALFHIITAFILAQLHNYFSISSGMHQFFRLSSG